MVLLRKIDYYIQIFIGILMILSVPVLFLYGFLTGLFVLGCWHLFSAAFNTRTYIIIGLSKQVNIYWKWTGLILFILFLSIFLSRSFDQDYMHIPACVAVIGSVPVAIYYLYIYNKMISHISMKKELEGVIKSKH